MRDPVLEAWIRRIVLASVPVVGLGCGDLMYDCSPRWSKVLSASEAEALRASPPDVERCRELCVREPLQTTDPEVTGCRVEEDALTCEISRVCAGPQPIPGRLSDGVSMPAFAVVDAAVWLARAASFEAASIGSFARLERELAGLGAPSSLLSACERARVDEERHARTMTALARRFGATAVDPEPPPSTERTAFAIARENVVEGCVHETWAAVVAALQAETATDPTVRRALRVIARDEARHAALAHAIDRWIAPRLAPEDRRALDEARRDAASRLTNESPPELPDADAALLGLDASALRHLATGAAPRLAVGFA